MDFLYGEILLAVLVLTLSDPIVLVVRFLNHPVGYVNLHFFLGNHDSILGGLFEKTQKRSPAFDPLPGPNSNLLAKELGKMLWSLEQAVDAWRGNLQGIRPLKDIVDIQKIAQLAAYTG